MFWNVTFIYNAFIRTTVYCKVQTACVSLFYIFINMKPWKASNSSVVVGRPRPLRHLTNFCTNFFNFGKSLQFANFFCWGNEFSIYDQHDINKQSSSVVWKCHCIQICQQRIPQRRDRHWESPSIAGAFLVLDKPALVTSWSQCRV